MTELEVLSCAFDSIIACYFTRNLTSEMTCWDLGLSDAIIANPVGMYGLIFLEILGVFSQLLSILLLLCLDIFCTRTTTWWHSFRAYFILLTQMLIPC